MAAGIRRGHSIHRTRAGSRPVSRLASCSSRRCPAPPATNAGRIAVGGSYVVNAATKNAEEVIAFLNSFATPEMGKRWLDKVQVQPGIKSDPSKIGGPQAAYFRRSRRRMPAPNTIFGIPVQVMTGKPKEVFTQVINNAFPAGNISVEDAVKQMEAAIDPKYEPRLGSSDLHRRDPQPRALSRPPICTPWGTITAFLLPALTLYVAFTAYPAVRTLWNSFHTVLPRREEFVGLANFEELRKDEIFWRAVRNTIIWACTSPLIEVQSRCCWRWRSTPRCRARAFSAWPGSRRC